MTNPQIERRGHIVGFQEKIEEAANRSKDAFFGWFANDAEMDTAFIHGSWDFSCHFATAIAPWLREPRSKTVLEIGHGGGRILAAAARHFGKAVGVDIHAHNDLVTAEFERRGVKNVELLRGSGTSLPVADASVDVVYSFIVFQHFEKIEILRAYFREARRVLKQGGVAVLYFGRKSTLSLNHASRLRFLADCLLEPIRLPKGYCEVPAAVNSTNLFLTRAYARKLALETGFDVVRPLVSRRKVPNGRVLFGGQHGLVLRPA